MLNFYQEIKLFPEEEIPIHFLWSKVYQQLHLGLVEMQGEQKRVPIGISFPEYVAGEKYSVLGGKCRLIAQDESTLAQFNVTKWLARLSDYVHCTAVRPVPEKHKGYAIYQRLQPKINKERLARRYARRHQQTYEQALQQYTAMPPAEVTAPFIRLHSLSSEQIFCLWIKKVPVSEPAQGFFSTYGLSGTATVPEF